MVEETKFKGSRIPVRLIGCMDQERKTFVPPLTWSQLLRKILTERYAKKGGKK